MAEMDHSSGSGTSSAADDGAATHNATDTGFAQGMIPHHRQAVEMSALLLAKDDADPAVTDLAERITAEQEPEIVQIRGFLERWGETVPDDTSGGMAGVDHGDGGMTAMMSEEDLAQLEAASGAEAGRLYLEQMTVHHECAVEMAQVEVDGGQDLEARAVNHLGPAGRTAEIPGLLGVLVTR